MDDNLHVCIDMLADNHVEICRDALRVLLKICDNIIKYPDVAKYRRIQVANAKISDKLLPASGGIECLFELGFIEDGECFFLPSNASLSQVRKIEKLLRQLWSKKVSLTPTNTTVQLTGPKQVDVPQPSFFQTIINSFHSVLRYEDKELQKITKRLVPINRLQLNAMKGLRVMQKKIKLDSNFNDEELSIEDLFLAELLYWFKNEFFTWVDSPTCKFCFKPCSFDRNEYTGDAKISRIEIHKCKTCGREEKFVRYTDPEILLNTRKGRCGEWANVFTLICRTLGYDARIVYDKTDHVWTEVWSTATQRWIHADSCENAMDCPLLYEKGWKKKLTYVIAYSRDEIQDVTWRYTKNQTAVLKRRNICSEESLSALIQRLNDERQNSSGYSDSRKRFVVKRQLMELAEFLQPPPGFNNGNENDDNKGYGGRISGDAAWRLARGELSDTHESHIWNVPCGVRIFQLRYFIANDLYDVRDENNKLLETKKNWMQGVNTFDGGIFRNIENDWKMTYLTRSPGNITGNITWSFEISDDSISVKSFELQTASTVFNGATVEWSIQVANRDNSSAVLMIYDCKSFKTTELKSARKFSVTAKLSGGTGDVAWQHAQLFRQPIDATEQCSMMMKITLNE